MSDEPKRFFETSSNGSPKKGIKSKCLLAGITPTCPPTKQWGPISKSTGWVPGGSTSCGTRLEKPGGRSPKKPTSSMPPPIRRRFRLRSSESFFKNARSLPCTRFFESFGTVSWGGRGFSIKPSNGRFFCCRSTPISAFPTIPKTASGFCFDCPTTNFRPSITASIPNFGTLPKPMPDSLRASARNSGSKKPFRLSTSAGQGFRRGSNIFSKRFLSFAKKFPISRPCASSRAMTPSAWR